MPGAPSRKANVYLSLDVLDMALGIELYGDDPYVIDVRSIDFARVFSRVKLNRLGAPQIQIPNPRILQRAH